MRPLNEKVSITLDNDIVKRLKEEAEKDERTFSQYINLVLKEHVKNLILAVKNNKTLLYENIQIRPLKSQ